MENKSSFIILILIAVAMVIAVAITAGMNLQLAPVFGVVLTTGLIAVTIVYVYWTAVMAKNSKRQAEIMTNAEFNAAAPVVQLDAADSVTTRNDRTVRIYWRNIGKGPALNFRCWIDDPENTQLRILDKAIHRTAVAVDTNLDSGHFSNFVNIDTGIDDYRLQRTPVCIRAQYESVFGKTYESSLHFPTNAAPELKFGEVKKPEDIVILSNLVRLDLTP